MTAPERYQSTPLNIICPHLVAPQLDGRIDPEVWGKATVLTDFRREDGALAERKTTLWIGRDDAYLYLAARCEEPNTDALQRAGSPYSRRIDARDHVDIRIDPSHDHVNFIRLTVSPFDYTEAAVGSYRMGYRAGPGSRWIHHTDDARVHPHYFRYASTIEHGKGWSFEMAIPYESLLTAPPSDGTVWGINVSRYTSWPVFQSAVDCNVTADPRGRPAERSFLSIAAGHSPNSPLAFADLCFDKDPVMLENVDFGTPHMGSNAAALSFTSSGGGDMIATASVQPSSAGRTIDAAKETPLTEADSGRSQCELSWKARHYTDTNILKIDVKDAAGRRRWHGSYEFGWEQGTLPLLYLHRGECDSPPANPNPEDPDFLIKKAQYIAARQHRFHRRTTADGMPSDFTIASSDGAVLFNLMEEQCLDSIANYVHATYDNDTDRLLGMMFLIGQHAFMRAHPAYDPNTSGRLETLSLLRFGSGWCGHMARVMAVILNRMEVGHSGSRHRARCFGIGGHGLVLVEYRDDYAILDSKHLTLYYRLDNSDMATLSELRRFPEIGRRAYPSQMPALMTFDASHIPAYQPDTLDGTGLIHPQGAPPEKSAH